MTYQLSQFTFDNSNEILGQTPAGQNILLGGFSGLYFDTEEDGKYYFYTVPDRGPNGEPTDTDGDGIKERPFALPDYQARIIRLVYDPELGTVELDNTILLTNQDGTPITGLPNLQAQDQGLAYTDEIPIDLNGNVLTNDPFGADLESIIKAPDGTFWASDEYRPAIYHFDENGGLIDRFIPEGTAAANGDPEGTYGTETLPEIYAQRRANRGFEGMALDTDNNKLYAWIQSPIDNPDVTNDANSKASTVLRILEVEPTNGEPTGEYIQILNNTDKAVDKIGDAVYQGDGKFLVIERDSAVGEDSNKLIFEVDINNATNILGSPLSSNTSGLALEGLTGEEIKAIDSLEITRLGSYDTGLEAGAEIAAYDADSQTLFVTNGATNSVDIIDISDPTNPSLVDSFDIGSFFGGINSVAAKEGIYAVAVAANNLTDNGFVIINDFGRNGDGVQIVQVGALPDMVTFTPDGNKILVANEGEPNEDYSVDPEGSVSVIDISNGVMNFTVNTATFTEFNAQEDELKAAGVRIFGLGATVAEDVEPEYIAVSEDGLTAFVTLQENNAVAVLDVENAEITEIQPLGFKDHSLAGNGLDASDRDDAINIQNYPIFGMYQPDSIATYQVGEETYYVTANEGDARLRPTDDDILPPPNDEEGDIFNEEDRIKDLDLDPDAFPNAEELQADENMGRLNITNTLGDTDGDGDYDELYAYGARSFSIFDSEGNLVFDSGDQFEQITAALFPELFNSQGDADSFDNRSDNKGPEPEGITVGEIDGQTYAFIGLERIGGFMTYNITDPTEPLFVGYTNDNEEGDLSPEGVLFIPSEDSPTGDALVVVTNEVSGNTVIYSVEPDTGIQPVEKTFLFNAAELGYTAGDKPEGLALLPDGDIAILNDNDFGLLGEEIPGDGSVPINPEPVEIVLGIVEAETSVRFATFNAALNRSSEGQLFTDLSNPEQQQIKNVAEIIQRVNPDVLLINEFDYNTDDPLANPQLFLDNYLEVQQNPDVEPITYHYIYVAPVNTGVASGFDLDRNGVIVTTPGEPGYGNDAWGFGNFEGQYAMVLFSKYPIVTDEVRTFQNFLWKDMPNALLPDDPNTPEEGDWYSEEILAEFPLSSKSHWDVPIEVDGEIIHALVSHPTPPVFDGEEDRNGRRNSDEIRFWSDYVDPDASDYIYDDQGNTGGLESGSHFVIMGDQNADPFDGDSTPPAISQLLDNPYIQGSATDASITPFSAGAVDATIRQGGANLTHEGSPAYDTGDFNPNNPGNLRADYVLPSTTLTIDPENKGVFWLTADDPDFDRLIGDFDPNLDPENFPEGFLSSDHRLVYMDLTPTETVEPEPENFTLQILHASDQEAGVPAFQDIPGLSAVMNALEDDYENTLKLTSGDIFIAGPFFDGSREIYDDTTDNEPIGQPGIADILIQNELGWDVASVGNHEFDAGDETFLTLLAPNENWVNGENGGVGIGEEGYLGALFPYLANNLDYSNADLPEGLTVVENGGSPQPNTLTGSVVTEVNGEEIGIIGIVTPYLESIANTGDVDVTTDDPDGNSITPTTPIDVQVDSIIANITPEVEALTDAGVNKLILMTHLQESAIEQALAQEMADLDLGIDVLIGGGSHQVMADEDTIPPLREDETQQTNGQLLQPYPQIFTSGEETVYYVNTGANYRYLSQLVVTFDEDGKITSVGDDSGTYATDIAGVDRLYEEDITTIEEVKALADPDVVAIVEGVEDYVNELDGDIFGQTDVFLNGTRGDVRTQETNLGNLTSDAQDYYAEAYLGEYDLLNGFEEINISFKNGGGIRDNIGVSFIEGGSNELIQLPPQANPAVGKEEGDVSALDISNSLRFNNDLVVGTVTAEGLLQIAEHMVSAVELTSGRFGQISGFKFSYNPDAPSGSRIENLALTDEDGESIKAIVKDGELAVDADETFSVVTLGFLAGGGDGYPDVIQNQVALSDFAEPDELGQADLTSGSEQDALAEYLSAFYNEDSGQDPYAEADTPESEDERIQNLSEREDTVLDGIESPEPSLPKVVSGTPDADIFDSVFPDDKQFVGDNQILSTGSGDDMVDVTYAVGGNIIRLASGNDMIFAGTDNRIDAGVGDDILFLGSVEGGNRVTGGLGADQFWVTEDDELLVSNPNIIGDFTASEGDVIGFLATELTYQSLGMDWNLRQEGSNTVIEAFEQDIAILNGIVANSLTEANFVFA